MENRIEKNEKKVYETPIAEKIEFQYEEQVAASYCKEIWTNESDKGGSGCESEVMKEYNN